MYRIIVAIALLLGLAAAAQAQTISIVSPTPSQQTDLKKSTTFVFKADCQPKDTHGTVYFYVFQQNVNEKVWHCAYREAFENKDGVYKADIVLGSDSQGVNLDYTLYALVSNEGRSCPTGSTTFTYNDPELPKPIINCFNKFNVYRTR